MGLADCFRIVSKQDIGAVRGDNLGSLHLQQESIVRTEGRPEHQFDHSDLLEQLDDVDLPEVSSHSILVPLLPLVRLTTLPLPSPTVAGCKGPQWPSERPDDSHQEVPCANVGPVALPVFPRVDDDICDVSIGYLVVFQALLKRNEILFFMLCHKTVF